MLRAHFFLGIGLLAVLAGGCPPPSLIIDGKSRSYEAAAAPVFDDARDAHEQERHDEAVERLEYYLTKFPAAEDADEALWLLAQSRFALGHDSDARQALRTLLERHPLSTRRAAASLELGAHLRESVEYVEAAAVLAPAYDEAVGRIRIAIALELLDVYLALEHWTNATSLASEIIDEVDDGEIEADMATLLEDLISEKVSQGGLAELREGLPERSAAMPLVVRQIALIHYEEGDYELSSETLSSYLSRWPRGDFAEEARELLERIEQLGKVRPRVVGVVLPLSERWRHFGEAVLQGIGMALDDTSAEGVRLIIRDSEGDPEVTAAAIEELVLEEQAIAVIGPLLANTSLAAAQVADELGVPLISLARVNDLTDIGPWVFRNALTDALQARALVDYAVETLEAERFGILYPSHAYGEGLMNHFWDELDARKLDVRGVERYEPEETTFQPIVRKLVARHHLQYRPEYMEEMRRVRSEVTDPMQRRRAMSRALDELEPIVDFDVLFIPDSYRTIGLIAPALAVEDVITNVCDTADLRRIKETTGRDELAKVHLLGPNAWNHNELITRGGRHVRCSVFVDGFFAESARGDTKAFVEHYRQIHGVDSRPDYLEAYGYDTAAIVGHIIEEIRPSSRPAFRRALLDLEGFPGATGVTTFSIDGEAEKQPFLLTVEGDQIVEIELEAYPDEVSTEEG